MKLILIKMGEAPLEFRNVVQVDYNDFKEQKYVDKLHTMSFIIELPDGKKQRHFIDLSGDVQVIIVGD